MQIFKEREKERERERDLLQGIDAYKKILKSECA
jgi:hypothetical protein